MIFLFFKICEGVWVLFIDFFVISIINIWCFLGFVLMLKIFFLIVLRFLFMKFLLECGLVVLSSFLLMFFLFVFLIRLNIISEFLLYIIKVIWVEFLLMGKLLYNVFMNILVVLNLVFDILVELLIRKVRLSFLFVNK